MENFYIFPPAFPMHLGVCVAVHHDEPVRLGKVASLFVRLFIPIRVLRICCVESYISQFQPAIASDRSVRMSWCALYTDGLYPVFVICFFLPPL